MYAEAWCRPRGQARRAVARGRFRFSPSGVRRPEALTAGRQSDRMDRSRAASAWLLSACRPRAQHLRIISPQLPTAVSIDRPDPCSVDSAQRNGDVRAWRCSAWGRACRRRFCRLRSNSSKPRDCLAAIPILEPEDATMYTTGVVFRAPSDSPLSSDCRCAGPVRIEIENVMVSVFRRRNHPELL